MAEVLTITWAEFRKKMYFKGVCRMNTGGCQVCIHGDDRKTRAPGFGLQPWMCGYSVLGEEHREGIRERGKIMV
jgi:hypothetical protein